MEHPQPDDLYFFYSARAKAIKIGRSYEPSHRLDVLRYTLRLPDLEILAVFPGRGEDEYVVLDRWRPHRIKGELFHAELDLCKWIGRGCKLGELPCWQAEGGDTVHGKIREARRVAGLTQAQAATELWGDHRRQADWSEYEAGKAMPSLPILRKIARVLGVEIGELVK